MKKKSGKSVLVILTVIVAVAMVTLCTPVAASASCAAPLNQIEAENCKAGNPSGEWDIDGAGDPGIQGFATDISVNRGETVHFKIQTDASAYRLDIYRIGYYGGAGARKVASVQPSATLPQIQPACLNDTATKLTDCGNWSESATWGVPVDAVSGVYIAKLVRTDTSGASHIIFIVRDDSGGSDVLFKTSDTTWQAYNSYGLGYIEYPDYGYPSQKATKVSYNRPFLTRSVNGGMGDYNWFFQSEYPMIRWLEANGYNVSYFTSVDADRRGAEILEHKVLLSLGHDEYWSGQMRANVEAARDAGVNLAFFSGNEIYRKIRWENSIDATGTPYRTMVCYNESNAPGPIDPADPPIWTGTWRNPSFSPPADGGRPENALSGTLFTVSTGPNDQGISLEVPQANGRLRFWRNTAPASLAVGQKAILGDRVVGYEFDEEIDNGFRPAGLMQLSSTTTPVSAKLIGDNINIARDIYLPGTATHVMTLYRAPSKALVFSAGTVQWSWGLDGEHDNGPSVIDPSIRQATVNLFADMGVQPASLQSGLVAASASTDTTAPVSTITSPASGTIIQVGTPVTIGGTAVDSGGGVVGAVEVSTDGGTSWHPATGRESWSYSWTPAAAGSAVIRSRGVDDSGNLGTASAGVSVTITSASQSAYTIWPVTTVPGLVDGGADLPVELGVKFRSDVDGHVTGIRFYKASSNTGTHTGSLWTSGGTRLATATFTGETASGWQQVSFSSPVAITANTVYVASYHVNGGHYSADVNYFTGKGMDSPPLHALASGVSGSNGVYAYGSTSNFPTQSWNNANYWVDVALTTAPPAPLVSIAVTPASPTIASGATQQFTATGSYGDGSTKSLTSQVNWSSSNTGVATITTAGLATGMSAGSSTISATLSGISGSTALTVQSVPLAIMSGTLPGAILGSPYSAPLAAGGGTLPYNWTVAEGALPGGLTLNIVSGVISGTPTASGNFSFTVRATDSGSPQQTVTKAFAITVTAQTTFTIWPGTTVPGLVDGGADLPVELGVKFRSDVDGHVTGIRFYKASSNTGTHTGSLWTSGGTRLATATFTNETASGWQQVTFSSPVAITANTVYVASYHVNGGHYSADVNYFTGKGMDSPPLHALASGVSGSNGVYAYGSTSNFPTQSWNNANYWVDVVLNTAPPAPLVSIAVTPASPTIASGATQQFAATGSYGDGSTKSLTSQVNWSSSNTDVATITTAGLATGMSAGSSTISATLSGISGSTLLAVQNLLTVTTTALSNGVVNNSYAAVVTAGGGTQPFIWTVTGGALPAGLTLDSATGVISGIPTATGSFSFTVQVKDSSSPQQSASRTLGVVITAPAPVLQSIAVSPEGLTVTIGGAQQFTATGTYSDGSTQSLTSQVAWSSSNTGVATITTAGLATGIGVGNSIVTATLASISISTALTVQAAPLTITTGTLSDSLLGIPYSATLAAGGGTLPNSWTVTNGALPDGLTLNAASGVISGTPTAVGSFSFTVRATDSGSPQQTVTKSFAITVTAQTTFTIWPATTVPGLKDGGADLPVELGVKFRSDVSGYVTGIRFYKATTNTGTHTGSLWTSGGTRLATATFTGETASGWQQVSFFSPVAITANTVYVASYHVNGGHYSADVNYFTGKGMDSPPLHALASGVSGSNGVYAYGSTSNFPTQSWNNANYWVDVVLSTASQAPLVSLAVTPASPTIVSGATQQFSVTGTYADGSTKSLTNQVSWSSSSTGVATITTAGLATGKSAGSSTITATLTGISSSTSLTVLNALSVTTTSLSNGVANATYSASLAASGGTQPYSWTVVSGALPDGLTLNAASGAISGIPTQPGSFSLTVRVVDSGAMEQSASRTLTLLVAAQDSPILIISSASNPFSNYYPEILTAEGFNAYAVRDIASVSPQLLASCNLAILGEMELTAAQVTMLSDWVTAGGNLIAMKPDKKLASLLGLIDKSSTLSNAYLLVETSSGPGSGIVNESIQFHGTADRYQLNGADKLATLYSQAGTSALDPAVTVRSVGNNGGEAAAFTYDLARSIVYTRQGNPAWAGQERDGLSPIRSNDLFYGAANFDPQPDWVDMSKVAIPQADEQQRLLANLIIRMNFDRIPLPRFWYLPRNLPAAVVMSGDDHGNNGTAGRFDAFMAMSPAGCSVENWECVRGTSYIYPATPLSPADAAAYVADGFEIGAHVSSNCADWTPYSLETFFTHDLDEWSAKYSGLPAPATGRLHCIAWSDYSSMATVERTHGIRFDTNYYYWPSTWVYRKPGYFTGSGMPMRFADINGNAIDVYQATTQLTDESGQDYPDTIDTMLEKAIGPEGYYGVLTANMHTDDNDDPEPLMVVTSALAHGIPVVTARQMLDWLDGRNGSSFSDLAWSGSALTLSISASPGANGLIAMAPVPEGKTVSGISKGGSPVSFTLAVVKGVEYARFPATSGNYRIEYVVE